MTEEVYKCPFCKYTTKYYSIFIRHIKQTHNLMYCPICGKKVKHLSSHAYFKGAHSQEHLELFLLLRGELKR